MTSYLIFMTSARRFYSVMLFVLIDSKQLILSIVLKYWSHRKWKGKFWITNHWKEFKQVGEIPFCGRNTRSALFLCSGITVYDQTPVVSCIDMQFLQVISRAEKEATIGNDRLQALSLNMERDNKHYRSLEGTQTNRRHHFRKGIRGAIYFYDLEHCL